MKYIRGPMVNRMGTGKPYGNPTLIKYRDLQKLCTLNKYDFFIFIYYKETMKILVAQIN